MSTNYEPTPEAEEREERALNALLGVTYIQQAVVNVEALRRIAVRNLRRQHEREAGLLEALRELRSANLSMWAVRDMAEKALAAHAALDAPPEPPAPTLLEAAKACEPSCHVSFADSRWAAVDAKALDALKAAVERAEREGK